MNNNKQSGIQVIKCTLIQQRVPFLGPAVLKQLRSFPKNTACGRSGWRVEHLLQCCTHPAAGAGFLESLTKFVNWLASGSAGEEFAPLIASAPLTPLLKKDGGIRPIAVGEVFRRLVSKCFMSSIQSAATEYLAPLQLGVGVQGGVEAILHSMNQLAAAPVVGESVAFLLVDFKNAFNCVSREHIFGEVQANFPMLTPWVEFTYGCASHLFIGEESIWSTSGVQQGDPLGPLLFALVLQPVLRKIKDLNEVVLAAYLDDLSIVGRPEHLRHALDVMAVECLDRGLHVSETKTVVWGRPGSSPVADERDTRLRRHLEGVTVVDGPGVELLGGCVSCDPTFVNGVIAKRLDKCFASMDLVLALKDPQLALLLFRACEGMQKLRYSWRTCKPWLIDECIGRARDRNFAALQELIVGDGPRFTEFIYELATLPVSQGGLGVFCPRDVAAYAYAGSWLDTRILQSRILGIPAHPPKLLVQRYPQHFASFVPGPSSFTSASSASSITRAALECGQFASPYKTCFHPSLAPQEKAC